MSENIKFSVIIPCYNVEKYIRECVESVINQTYSNWELLLVNDASSDNTLDIIQQMEQKDQRITAYDKEHGGPAHTRNFAIKRAAGDYLVFLDGDDKFSPDHLEKDYKILSNTSCDMLIHNQHTYFTESKSNIFILFNVPETVLSNKEKLEYVFSPDHYLPAATCMVTYKLSFINAHSISFNDEYTVSEDLDLFMQVVCHYPHVEFANHEFYFYRQDNQLSITGNLSAELELERLQIYKKWYDYFQNKHIIDFDAQHIQRKLANDLRGEVYVCRDLNKSGFKEPKIFLHKNSYLLSYNSFINSFFFIYYIKYPLRKIKRALFHLKSLIE